MTEAALSFSQIPMYAAVAIVFVVMISILVAALVVFAVIPFGSVTPPVGESQEPIALVVLPNFDAGLLFVFALAEIAVYGVLLGGWASNSNFGMLGSLRVSAQMLSYEVAMGISLIGVFLCFGTLKLTEMGAAQQETFQIGRAHG